MGKLGESLGLGVGMDKGLNPAEAGHRCQSGGGRSVKSLLQQEGSDRPLLVFYTGHAKEEDPRGWCRGEAGLGASAFAPRVKRGRCRYEA